MSRTSDRVLRRQRRRRGMRKRIFGTPDRPRLSVYRSLRYLYAQVIDDVAGRTIAAASSRDAEFKGESTGDINAAKTVGALLAQRAGQAGVKQVQFDRNGLRYHGRVKALADAAREAGLQF
ncbi:MAG: 50S ribosomal protein L18 [Phycisphaerales bacterium]|nr:50S ribosomal protein L18 [Phycisphaerales bacterium]